MIESPAIQACTCKHGFQDQRYGFGQRVMNPKKNGDVSCTVCGRRHDRTHKPVADAPEGALKKT